MDSPPADVAPVAPMISPTVGVASIPIPEPELLPFQKCYGTGTGMSFQQCALLYGSEYGGVESPMSLRNGMVRVLYTNEVDMRFQIENSESNKNLSAENLAKLSPHTPWPVTNPPMYIWMFSLDTKFFPDDALMKHYTVPSWWDDVLLKNNKNPTMSFVRPHPGKNLSIFSQPQEVSFNLEYDTNILTYGAAKKILKDAQKDSKNNQMLPRLLCYNRLRQLPYLFFTHFGLDVIDESKVEKGDVLLASLGMEKIPLPWLTHHLQNWSPMNVTSTYNWYARDENFTQLHYEYGLLMSLLLVGTSEDWPNFDGKWSFAEVKELNYASDKGFFQSQFLQVATGKELMAEKDGVTVCGNSKLAMEVVPSGVARQVEAFAAFLRNGPLIEDPVNSGNMKCNPIFDCLRNMKVRSIYFKEDGKPIQNISGATGKAIFSDEYLSQIHCIEVSANGNENNRITLTPIASSLMSMTLAVVAYIAKSLVGFWKPDKKKDGEKNERSKRKRDGESDQKTPRGVMSFPIISSLQLELKKQNAREATAQREMIANIDPDSKINVFKRRNELVQIGNVKPIKVKLTDRQIAQLEETNERLLLELKNMSGRTKLLTKNYEDVVAFASKARGYLKQGFVKAFPDMTTEAIDDLISRCTKARDSDSFATDDSEDGE